MERRGAVTRKPARAASKERGCLALLLSAWLAWLLIDLGRLGVLGGRRALGDAVFDMPSLLALLLLVVGFGPTAFRAWRQTRRKRAFPEEPWMWERLWDRRGARPLEWRELLPPLAVGIPITVVAPLLVLVALYVVRSDVLLLALTPLYLIVLGFWVWWGFRLARLLRFRHPYFRHEHFPFFLGGSVEGAIEGVELLEGCERLTATLRCVREEWRGSGKNATLSRTTMHEEAVVVGPAGWVRRLVGPAGAEHPGGATRVVVPLRFALPAEQAATNLLGQPAFRWELETRAERPGFDFQATFLLPVYPPPAPAAGGGERAGP